MIITFRVRRSGCEICIGHARLCVCICLSLDLSVPRRIPTLLHGPGCTIVHYWADLQSVHGFHCYDNITPNAKYQRVLVLALCLVSMSHVFQLCNVFFIFVIFMF